MNKVDIIIVGAGPVGLFTVFEAGLLKMRCHIIDALPQVGGQCSEIYPKKPIYDIPGYPNVLAGDLIDNLMEQIKPFEPTFTLGEKVETVEKQSDETFKIITDKENDFFAPIVIIAGGLGFFEPRKPPIPNLEKFENKGIYYAIKEPDFFLNKKIAIAGGGDSALDWANLLADKTDILYLIHRRASFRGANDTLEKILEKEKEGKIKIITESEVCGLFGDDTLNQIELKTPENKIKLDVDFFLPLFGYTPKIDSMKNWGLEMENNKIKVNNNLDYSTNTKGIFAVGDINTYPGKLNLILCGFHETTLACQAAYNIIYPDKKIVLKYTTVNGINPF